MTLPRRGYNYGNSLTNLFVAWYPPLDGDPDLMFANLTLMIIAEPTLPAFFVLGPAVPTSFPEENLPGYGYWDGNDVPLVPLDYAFGDPAAARFEPGTVEVESRSLSAVKELFD